MVRISLPSTATLARLQMAGRVENEILGADKLEQLNIRIISLNGFLIIDRMNYDPLSPLARLGESKLCPKCQ